MVYVTAPSVQERSRECKDSRDLSRLQPYTFADFRYMRIDTEVPDPFVSQTFAKFFEIGCESGRRGA